MDFDMTLGGEGDGLVSSPRLLVTMAGLSMEEKYGDHAGGIESLGYEVKRAGMTPALCRALDLTALIARGILLSCTWESREPLFNVQRSTRHTHDA